jgi:hypothetical protein
MAEFYAYLDTVGELDRQTSTPLVGSAAQRPAHLRSRSMLDFNLDSPTVSYLVNIVEPPFQSPQRWTYDPNDTAVAPGTTVTWTNTGAVAHTVTADDGATFDSASLDPQATFSFTATTPGTFTYHCAFDPWMTGTGRSDADVGYDIVRPGTDLHVRWPPGLVSAGGGSAICGAVTPRRVPPCQQFCVGQLAKAARPRALMTAQAQGRSASRGSTEAGSGGR